MVEISANDGEAVTNELIRGEIKGLKTDENGTGLGGAVIGLFKSDETEFTAENALATATSAEDGSFSFTNVPYGNWVLKELESPEGFILSDEVIPVTVEEDGQVVEISLANERVYGDLRLTKVDKDYPDNKLTGAEFEVYRDTNGNKELDEGDELLGKLEETSTGIYEMAHILYGGVFVKETKAPEGFLLDENAYYVEITENGKIYEVENEAGIGGLLLPRDGAQGPSKLANASHRHPGGDGGDPRHYRPQHPGGAVRPEQKGAGRPEQNPQRQAGGGASERGGKGWRCAHERAAYIGRPGGPARLLHFRPQSCRDGPFLRRMAAPTSILHRSCAGWRCPTYAGWRKMPIRSLNGRRRCATSQGMNGILPV